MLLALTFPPAAPRKCRWRVVTRSSARAGPCVLAVIRVLFCRRLEGLAGRVAVVPVGVRGPDGFPVGIVELDPTFGYQLTVGERRECTGHVLH